MNNVHKLEIKPKTERHQYRQHTIVITFVPRERMWKWKFAHQPRLSFSGQARTLQRALREAKKEVDTIVDGR